MGRIVAISGGDLESTRAINEYTIQMTGKKEPNVLFIGTASKDAKGYIERIRKHYNDLGCKVEALCLYKRVYEEEEIDQLLRRADIIYVGGGDTVSMMKKWRQVGLDDQLKEIYNKNQAVLTGISAGAICWFLCGHSDSEAFSGKENWEYIWAEDMIGIYKAAFCPHYNEEGRESFDEMLKEKEVIGLALENNVALVEENGRFKLIKTNQLAKAYKLSYTNGVLDKQELHIITL